VALDKRTSKIKPAAAAAAVAATARSVDILVLYVTLGGHFVQ